jgi:O-antigen/teichoic acid export membrane protein
MNFMSIKSKINGLLKNQSFRDIGTYSFYSTIEKAIPFFILPIYTRLLSIEETGYYILFIAIYSIALPLSKLGLDGLAVVNYFKLGNKEFKEYLSLSSILYILWFVIFLSICLILSSFIGDILKMDANIIIFIVLTVFPYYFISLRLNIYRASQQALNYSKLIILLSFLKHGISLLLLLFVEANWVYIVLAYGVSHSIISILSIISLIKDKCFSLSLKFKGSIIIIKEGYPLALNQMNIWFGSSYSRVAIADNMSIVSTGGFGIASTFQAAMSLIQESFDKAYVPKLFEVLKKNDHKLNSKIVKYSYYYYFILLLCGVAISIIGYYGLDIVYGDKFTEFKIYVPFLVMASLFNGFYKIHVAYIFFEKKMIYITLVTFLSSLTNVLLIYLLIGSLGLLGVVFALICSQIVAYIVAFYFGNKFHKMPWIKK